MNIELKKWHRIHQDNLRAREATREERLRLRKLDIAYTERKKNSRIHLHVPKQMDLTSNYEETIKFINQIKEHVFENRVFVFLEFSKCEYISTETCVMLAAEIDRCRRLIESSVSGSYPLNEVVYTILNELGFFSLLGVRSARPKFTGVPDVDVVRLSSGKDSPASLMKGIKELFFTNDGLRPSSPYSGKIFGALTEASANSIEHAYKADFVKAQKGSCLPVWWRAGFRNNKSSHVVITMYDQGAGIPNTITPTWEEKILAFTTTWGRQPSDSEKLDLAMEKGRTSTRVKGRGQGSYDMQKLIRESVNASLDIFSYQGRYTYSNDGSVKNEELKSTLSGTLITWQICLNTINRHYAEEN